MKLYFSKGACSMAIRITAIELGLTLDYEAVDLKTKKTEHGQDYLAHNPKGAVPALLLKNGEILTENAVIQQYLADTHHGTALLPHTGDFKRYRVLEWLNYISSDFHKSFSPLFNPKVPDDIKENFFIPILRSKLKFINEALGDRNYLVGESFTLPDGYLFTTLRWLPAFKIQLSDYPNLKRYSDHLRTRKSVQQALEEEGLS